jgi:FMN phosphatase YigB (HAD superfamily)
MSDGLAVFFDIGDTLASPRVVEGRLTGLDVYPFVPELLTRLAAVAPGKPTVTLGLISNTGDETAASMQQLLVESGLSTQVEPALCLFSSVEGLDKSQPAFFALARDRAGRPASRCLFVGEDAAERAVAVSVGFRVSPHPLHALHLVETTNVPPHP